MGRCIYGLASENVAPEATVTVETGTEDADYPAANLVDRNPALPAQLTGTSGAWLLDFGSAQRVDWVLLPHHNIDAALEVRIQGNATNSWGSPTLNTTITIPTYRDDGMPVGSWRDLTGVGGYSTGGFRYWRFVIVGTNSAAVKVGELALFSQKRTLNPNISWGAKVPERRPVLINETDYGVRNIYDLGTTIRRLAGELDTTDAGLTALRTWWRDARGRARSFGLVPDEDVNEAYLARFETDVDPTLVTNDRNTIGLDFQEVSRGLPL
jgi:hypothetical protein